MSQVDAGPRMGRVGPSVAKIEADSGSGGVHLPSLLLALFAAGLMAVAPFAVDRMVALLTAYDPEGVISKPFLLERPFYAVAIVLAALAVLQLALHSRGESLIANMLRDSRALLNVGISIVFAFVLSCMFLYAMKHPEFYRAYFYEDTPVEILTPLLYFVSIIVYAMALHAYMRVPDRAAIVIAAIVLCAVAALYLALEEISYGQRLFGWATPAALAGNVQNESNLHNLIDYETLDLLEWIAASFVFVAVCAMIYVRSVWQKPWLQYVPQESLLPLAAAVALLGSHGAPQEVFENCAALFALLYAVQLLRQARAAQSARATGSV